MKKQIAIIGDGGWGTALALVLHRNQHRVRIWGPFPDYIAELQDKGENRKFLPGVPCPPDLEWTASREEAVADADAVVLAVPSKFYRDVVTSFQPLIPPGAVVVSVTKGLDKDTHKRMTETAAQLLGEQPIVALSGPSHAEEVARGVPTALVAAGASHAIAIRVQELFNSDVFRVYTSDDPVGVELGGALKNVIAIAAGVSDGIGFGDNSKAALITRGLAEMTRLGVALGARAATFSGLSGMGDLIVTCGSQLSRNRRVGESLGRGDTLETIMQRTEQVAEGVWNCANARELARTLNIDVPITEEVYAIVHKGKDPRAAVTDLLTRDPRPEPDLHDS
jgi:glycerol-3-phosphate dehydrogenase (NAD(P)+)